MTNPAILATKLRFLFDTAKRRGKLFQEFNNKKAQDCSRALIRQMVISPLLIDKRAVTVTVVTVRKKKV